MANSKVSIFIDLANISKGFDVVKRNRGIPQSARIDYEKLIPALTLGSKIVSKSIYTVEMIHCEEEKNRKYKSFLSYLKNIGFNIKTKKMKKIISEEGLKNKADFDVEIAIDATISILKRDCNEIILISGDSDFNYLLATAKEENVKVTVVSTLGTLSTELETNTDRLILLDTLDMNQFIFSKVASPAIIPFRNISQPIMLLAA